MPPDSSASHQGNGHDARDRESILRDINVYTASLKDAWSSAQLPRDVSDALSYIHEHLFEEFTNASSVRHECGLRNHNISSIFKKHVGAGMQTYIETHRIEMAKVLLRHKTVPVIEIAWAVGYGNPETFSRAFRRNTGVPPSAYRASSECRHPARPRPSRRSLFQR